MRAKTGLALILLLGVPSAGAATQDAILTEYASFGDDDLFADYPALLFLKLTISNRLQTGQAPAAELVQLERVLSLLKEIDRLHEQRNELDRERLLDGFEACAALRGDIGGLNEPGVEQYREILNLTAAGITRSYVQAAERLLPALGRTSQRLSLLSEAVDAANAIQDGLAYSRLSQLEDETRADYDADSARANAAIGEARSLLATSPNAASLEFPRHYATLFGTRERLATAHGLFTEHGESENAAEAQALSADINERIRQLGLLITGVVLAYLLLVVGLGALLLQRIVRWTQHRHRAGLGDELALGGA